MAPKKEEHSRLGGSNAKRYIHCPGSVEKAKGIPKKSNPAAEKGTAAHALGEHVLSFKLDKVDPQLVKDLKATKAWADDAVQMAEAVSVYVDWIRDNMDETAGDQLYIEQKFDIAWLHPEFYGTSDAGILKRSFFGNSMVVVDYKHGYGIVEVEHNEQLMFYALGVLGKDNPNKVQKVELVIIQPNAPHPSGPIRSWRTTAEELYAWGYEVLKPAAELASTDNAPLNIGPWCRYCVASGETCNLIGETASSLNMNLRPKDNELTFDNIDVQKAARFLDVIKVFEDWASNYKAYLTQRANSGLKIPGYKLVKARVNRKLRNHEIVENDLLIDYTEDQIFDKKLKSLGALEKVLGKSAMKHLWERPEAPLVLVHRTDSRKEERPKIESVFEPKSEIPESDFFSKKN
jgi:hypothetical protein